jgi:hypothetical protein
VKGRSCSNDWRIGCYLLPVAALLGFSVGSLAEDVRVKTPPAGRPSEFADPASTYRSYINAVRKTDLVAAKSCFTIHEDNKSGLLDVRVGLWTSTRRLYQTATEKLGAEAARAILEPLGLCRDDLSDAALDLTEARLSGAVVKFLGDETAELVVKWREDDGYPNAAFEYHGDDPIPFLKVKGVWKIDATQQIGGVPGEDLLKDGTWDAAFRDHVKIADEASDRLMKGTLKSSKDLKDFLAVELSAAEKSYKDAVQDRR